MCRIKIIMSSNSTLSLNSELKIIFGAQDPLYDTVCSIKRQLHFLQIFNTNHDTYRTGLLGNLKSFSFVLLLHPLYPGTAAVFHSSHYGPSQIHYS